MSKFKETLNTIIAQDEKNAEKAFLMSTTNLRLIKDADLRDLLTNLYKSKSLKQIVLASILNGVFTEFKATFLISKRELEKLLKSDKNIKRNTLNGDEYKLIWGFIFGNGVFKILKQESTGLRKASVIELASEALVKEFDKLVGKKFRESQKSKCVELFNSYSLKTQETSHQTSHQTSRKYKYKYEYDGKCNNDNDSEIEPNKESSHFPSTPVVSDKAGITPPGVAIIPPVVSRRRPLSARETPVGIADEIIDIFELLLELDSNARIGLSEWEKGFINDILNGQRKYNRNGLKYKQTIKYNELKQKYSGPLNLALNKKYLKILQDMVRSYHPNHEDALRQFDSCYGREAVALALMNNSWESIREAVSSGRPIPDTTEIEYISPIQEINNTELDTADKLLEIMGNPKSSDKDYEVADRLYKKLCINKKPLTMDELDFIDELLVNKNLL